MSIEFMKFILPFHYLFVSRLRPLKDKISWFLIFPVPVILLVVFSNNSSNTIGLVVVTFLGLFAAQSLYEIGYLVNDVLTVRNEKSPTIRLSSDEQLFVIERFNAIVSARIILFIITAYCIYLYGKYVDIMTQSLIFLAMMAITQIAFLFHNYNRNRLNVLSYFILSTGRYTSAPLLLANDSNVLILAITTILMMPLLRTIEHACKPKYNFKLLRNVVVPFEKFRVLYYILITALSVIYCVYCNDKSMYIVGIFSYYTVYRLSVYIAIRKNIVTSTRHKSYE